MADGATAANTVGLWGARIKPLDRRLQALVLLAFAGAIAIFGLMRWLSATPTIDAAWGLGEAQADGQKLVLLHSADPALDALRGRALVAVSTPDGAAYAVDARLLHRWLRWELNDSLRGAALAQHLALGRCLATGHVQLHFEGGEVVTVQAVARGQSEASARIGLVFLPLAALSLLLCLSACMVVLARPQARTGLFAVILLCQAASLLLIGLESSNGLGLPAPGWIGDFRLRAAIDLCTGAAVIHGFSLNPRKLPHSGLMALAAWAVVPAWLLMAWVAEAPAVQAGWLAQVTCLALGLAAVTIMTLSHRLSPDPYARTMLRLSMAAVFALALATWPVAMAGSDPEVPRWASLAWHLFFSSLLLLMPWLWRGRQVLRDFAVMAGIGALTTALVLLLVPLVSIGFAGAMGFAAVAAVAAVVACGLLLLARLRFLKHLAAHRVRVTERTFDQLYRAAREAQMRPQHYPQLLAQLLRDLFEPMEMLPVERVPLRSRVIGGGSALLVPVRSKDDGTTPAGAMALRFAQQGERLFTQEDARLADRVIDQLSRAVAYDQAVERGRTEERVRIAQDLHDDIGARLLTLMYQAPTPELEDYIRHTLQDLKTLTRGLAVTEHRLSHAAAEWKADLIQRLTAAHVSLGWSVDFDTDRVLTVVQWSALTRVLRELVTNALYHGHAMRIEIDLVLRAGELRLQVSDDGVGRQPETWAHGLGLGGVRKRVKLLGGEVAWHENDPCGIACLVRISEFRSGS
jgi:signal transduction histidine kinase